MPSKFGGVAVTDEPAVSKFGGVPVDETPPPAATSAPAGNAFQRFSRALGEGNPLSMQHGTPEEMAQRVGRPLTEQLSELNPLNMVRGIVQPFGEMASGQVAEGLGHLIGFAGQGAPKPAGLRSPVTVGEPIIPTAPTMAARYIPGAREVGNIASDISRIRLRSPIAPWEPPTTPTTPVSPRFKGPIPEPEAPAAAPPAPIAKPATPPFTSMTPNPPNLRDWLRGGPETVPGRIGTTPVWRGLPEPTTPTPPPTTAIPATKTISGRTPGTGPDPFVGPTRPLEPASAAPARVTPINERPNTITSPETAPAVEEHPKALESRANLARAMGEQMYKAGVPVEKVANLPPEASFWKVLENKTRPDEIATRSEPPSPETIQLAKEHHARLMGQQAPLAKPFVPGSSLTGRSLDIAQQLKSEMEGAPAAEPATIEPPPKPSALPRTTKAKPAPEQSPPPATSASTHPGWMGTLSDAQRENLFTEMRAAGNKADAMLEEHNRLRPSYGQVAVGGAHIDPLIKAYAIEGMHRALNKGATIEAAIEAGKAEARLTAQNFNSKIPKSAGGYQIMRPEGMADAALEQYGRTLRKAVGK